MITTTLKEIRAKSPCTDGWEKLLKHLDKSGSEAKNDSTPLSVITVLESNGIDDALWVLDNCIDSRICVLFACDCAESVLHIFEKAHPKDGRPRTAIEVARDPNSSTDNLATAREAAGAAARAAEWSAAWAAGAAAGDTARAAGAAAWAAGAAARAVQERRLIQYLTHGESAADMEWVK